MLPAKALHELKEIMLLDYGTTISDDQVIELGVSLLRLTRVAVTTLARMNEKRSFIQVRGKTIPPQK